MVNLTFRSGMTKRSTNNPLLAFTSKVPRGLVVCLICIFISCKSSAPDVHFVLPDGYVGMFKIVLDEKEGVDVNSKDGRYAYEIPKSGILKVKSFAPFRPWHEESAAYRNGTKINLPGNTVPNESVALRDLGEYMRGNGPPIIVYVIGTKEEQDKLRVLMNSSDFEKIAPQFDPQSTPK